MAGLKPLLTPPRPLPPQLENPQLEQRSALTAMDKNNHSSSRHSHPRQEHRARSKTTGETANISGGPLNGHGPIPVRSGAHHPLGNGQPHQMPGPGRLGAFDGPRSPPNSKNTSHVPCKFFRQGACQAGKACPFSHSMDPTTTQATCKYFAKGNCKFGAKCALAHILPDGRRVNKPTVALGGANLNLGNRVNREQYQNTSSALANSLLHAHVATAPFSHHYPIPSEDEFLPPPTLPPGTYDTVPSIEAGFVSSHPGSRYGSPRDDTRFPVSPVVKGLSALDAPLPASFDSNGISWIARNGPVAASVPSKFGLESPPQSFKDGAPSDALRTLHDSAFGNHDRSKLSAFASSPPPNVGESSSQRVLHSQRYTRSKLMPASLPRVEANDDWDGNFAFEEDFIPNSLHELLTPQEKMRRFSRSGGEEEGPNPRVSLSGFGTPGESSSKVGSPTASSPSRFGALFARQRREEDSGTASGFGHVGSPLRNSSLNAGSSPALRAINRPTPGDVSPYFASPPRQTSMSMISQQLQRTRLNKSDNSTGDNGLHPGSAKQPTGQSGKLDRGLSSSSAGNGRTVSSIDEEQGEVFSMEEEEDMKRYSGGWNYPVGGRSPRLGPSGGGKDAVAGSEGRDGKQLLDTLYPGR